MIRVATIWYNNKAREATLDDGCREATILEECGCKVTGTYYHVDFPESPEWNSNVWDNMDPCPCCEDGIRGIASWSNTYDVRCNDHKMRTLMMVSEGRW